MARAKVIHSTNACMIKLQGNPKSPEPETCVIKFPGGHVEVTRTTDNKYWAHVRVEETANIIDSRIDYNHEGYIKADKKIPPIPLEEYIEHMAIKVQP